MRVLEGVWEEIEARAEELRGRRVRVIVLTEADMPQAETLREFLGEFVGCVDGLEEPVAERAEELLESTIAEAHRSQGLNL